MQRTSEPGLERALPKCAWVALLLMGGGADAGAADGGLLTIATPPSLGWEDTVPELRNARAVARLRLSEPGCQVELADFTDVSGRRLDLVLRANGRTPQ